MLGCQKVEGSGVEQQPLQILEGTSAISQRHDHLCIANCEMAALRGVVVAAVHLVQVQQLELDLLHHLHHLGQRLIVKERVGRLMKKLLEQGRRIEAPLCQEAVAHLPLLCYLNVQNQIVLRSTSISMD
jgi:hypothetical protein